MTGQSFGKVFGSKTEWFKILVEAPQVEKFVGRTREPFSNSDSRLAPMVSRAVYEHQTGYAGPRPKDDQHFEHSIHHAHTYGAILSIIIAFSGVFLAFLMYIRGSLNPKRFTDTFSGWTNALKNRYFFDHLYVDIIIQKGLIVFNRSLAWFDMGIYDRFAIDGWQYITRKTFLASKWFDNVIVDSIAVDGSAVIVNLFNLVLRVLQSGKIQFYFIVLILVLSGYIMSLNF
jgi:NADH-quinone oxidoreductase subunit L